MVISGVLDNTNNEKVLVEIRGYFLVLFPRSKHVTSEQITSILRQAVRFVGPSLGITEADVSAASLRPSGAMAMLCAGIDNDCIRLLGRWKSDTVYCYLTMQAEPLVRDLARQMSSSQYTFIPGHTAAEAQV